MTLTIEMPPQLEARLSVGAEREGLPLPEYVLRLLEEAFDGEATIEPHPILELAEKACASIPRSEWGRLPPDFARNRDYYRHGCSGQKE